MDQGIKQVKLYYDENAQVEWNRLKDHPFEFIFTTYMMDRYIKPGDRVLDVGGGPGRYSVHYGKKGSHVTLVDLSEGNISLAKEMAAKEGVELRAFSENCLKLDELDLGETFDHVFLMGPLYHLKSQDDRITAVKKALARLKPGGIFYCSFILDFAGMIYDMKFGPGFFPVDVEKGSVAQLLDSITGGGGYEGEGFTSVFFCNQRQIGPFMEQFDLEKLHLFGQEGVLAPNEMQLLSFPKEELDQWIEAAKKLLEVPELLSYSEHAMYIGRKK